MRYGKTCFLIAVAALFVFTATARAYVLIPEPQKTLWVSDEVEFDTAKIVVNTNINSHDPRILGSLKKIFPDLTVGDKPQAGGLFIVVADSSEESVLEKHSSLSPSDIDASGFGPQEFFLGVEATEGHTLALILFNRSEVENGVGDSYGAYYATKTLKQLVNGNKIQEISVHDWPDIPVRGILEGFYGKPWPRDARFEMVEWMSDYKYNIFLYTPKDDHKLRMGWRLSLNEKELAKVKYINDLANENYIRYCWSLSPGMSINFSSKKDLKSAYKKFMSVIKVGVKCFSLAFDDVSPALTPYDRDNYDTYWQAQVEFSNKLIGKLLEEHPDLNFAFVANDYWGEVAPKSESLRYLGEHLDQRVSIGWTGDEIAPARIIAEDAVFYERFIKRKPFMGDNYPVLDNISADGGRLALGPLRGRDPRLYRYIKGFAGNAMPLALSSKPAFITMADFVWNPMNYDMNRAWVNAYKALTTEESYEPLYFFSKQSQSSLIWSYDAIELSEELRAVLRAAQELPNYKMDEVGPPLRKTLQRFQGIDKEIEALRNPEISGMLDEMVMWIKKLQDYGTIGEKALDLLAAKDAGTEVAAADIDALEAEWKTVEENKTVITRMVMHNFMLQSLALLRGEELPEEVKMKSLLGD
ncbi:beta-N-acetylglucosaminidase domain-containing protein [bacterium]